MTEQHATLAVSFPRVPTVIFANWMETLHHSNLPKPVKSAYEFAIRGYLDYCRFKRLSVSTESARAYMADAERRQLATNPSLWKTGLNWFFAEGRKCSAQRPPGIPSLGQADTGSSDWERRMIERLRIQHYSWRTEQTYREWARRFAHFLAAKSIDQANGDDLKGFLSQIAVQGRVSVATPKLAAASRR